MVRISCGGALCLALVAVSCGRSPLDTRTDSGTGGGASLEHPRQAYFEPGAKDYGYYEGGAVSNRCREDRDCMATGCARSTCAAEVMTIPEDIQFCQDRRNASGPEPLFAECGCLSGECRWYFENDYDRACETDEDCVGLGPPPHGTPGKAVWGCSGGSCQYPKAPY